MDMKHFSPEPVRCTGIKKSGKVCGHLLLMKIADLPIEIKSTGAIVINIMSEIKCNKCKTVAKYSMIPTIRPDP